MLSNLKYIAFFILFLLFQGCKTYQTFYSETVTNAQQPNPENVLRLDLSGQNLKVIPEGLSQLRNLKMINLSGNPNINVALFFDAIAEPEVLEVLLLNDLALQELPESIQKFTNLKQLSLNGNPQLSWPETLQKIAPLPIQFLNLQYNKLHDLPQEISELQSLKDLNLGNNNITHGSTFTHLATLPKLYSLWLSNNNLKELSPEIGLLVQVNNLYLGHNHLSSLPSEMKTMKDVWVIQAEHNDFTSLPEVFIDMPSLFSVHLNNCKIDTIPDAFASKKYSMKGLLLDNNLLSNADKKRWEAALSNFFLLSIK